MLLLLFPCRPLHRLLVFVVYLQTDRVYTDRCQQNSAEFSHRHLCVGGSGRVGEIRGIWIGSRWRDRKGQDRIGTGIFNSDIQRLGGFIVAITRESRDKGEGGG